MKVDRKRFLSLATTIAGMTACATEPHAPVPELAPLEVAVPPPPPAPSATEPASAPVATVAPPAPVAEEAPALASKIDDYDPKGKHGCAELRCPAGHPFQEGMKVLQHDCRALDRGLRPEHFQRFIQCMLRQNDTRATCDLLLVGTDPGDCLERWSSPAAVEPETAATCAPILQKCANRPPPRYYPPMPGQGTPPPQPPKPPFTTAQCQGILSVTKSSARAKMVACMTEYCEEAPRLCYMSL